MRAVPDPVTVRRAAPGDLPAVAAIYTAGISERIATFETEPRAAGDLLGWLDDGLPFVVADGASGVIGWAKIHAYSDRCAYRGIGEHAVYVAPYARGRGIGRTLLHAVVDEAQGVGLHKLTSRILTENAASRAAHLAAGFEEVGIQRRHGRLDGRWHDVVLVERLLRAAS